jgi:hypothetical protein
LPKRGKGSHVIRVVRDADGREMGRAALTGFESLGAHAEVMAATKIQTPGDCVRLPRIVWYSRAVVTASTIVPTDSTARVGGTGP